MNDGVTAYFQMSPNSAGRIGILQSPNQPCDRYGGCSRPAVVVIEQSPYTSALPQRACAQCAPAMYASIYRRVDGDHLVDKRMLFEPAKTAADL